MRQYIIDGHNVLHANGAWEEMLRQSLSDAREALVEAVEAFFGRKADMQATIVFDGADVGSRTVGRNIVVRGTRRNQSADEVIRQLLARHSAPHTCIVVSSDHEVAGFARRYESETLSAAEFLQRLSKRPSQRKKSVDAFRDDFPREKPTDMSPEEMEEMKRLFGL